MDNQPILEAIDPEYLDRLAARKKEIDEGSWARPGVVAALALGSVPIALAALSRDLYGQTSTTVQNVLNFALALEIFENEFYKAVLGDASSPAAQRAIFNTARTAAGAVPGAVATLQQIQKHEAAHVATLTAAGAVNVFNLSGTSFDYSGGRGSGTGPFQGAGSDLALLLELTQGAEDTGVRAYKGQAGNLMSAPAVLETALRIHSVEARHASRIRRLRRLSVAGTPDTVRLSGTVRGGGAAAAGASATRSTAIVAAFAGIYGPGASATDAPSEDNVTQAGVNVSTLAGAPFTAQAAQEAFDEPLTRADVVANVQPFFIPAIS